jgi:hypothetical protein
MSELKDLGNKSLYIIREPYAPFAHCLQIRVQKLTLI